MYVSCDAYYSVDARDLQVHHVYGDCPIGAVIADRHYREGHGGRPKCFVCVTADLKARTIRIEPCRPDVLKSPDLGAPVVALELQYRLSREDFQPRLQALGDA